MTARMSKMLDKIAYKRTIVASGCWEWQGKIDFGGYGHIYFLGRYRMIHRVIAFICLGFDLDSKLLVMHKCDNRKCFNPLHLMFGTQDDNMKDMARKGRTGGKCKKQTHCKRGHEFTVWNTYIMPETGRKRCKTCYNANMRAWNKKQKAVQA